MFPGLWPGGAGGPSPENLERLKGMMVRAELAESLELGSSKVVTNWLVECCYSL